jgi:hypothetical protein
MDLVWISALSICLNLCINRGLGHLRGWRRLFQCPAIYLAVLSVHLMFGSRLARSLLSWQAGFTGISSGMVDLGACLSAGLAGGAAIRLWLQRY